MIMVDHLASGLANWLSKGVSRDPLQVSHDFSYDARQQSINLVEILVARADSRGFGGAMSSNCAACIYCDNLVPRQGP